MVALSGAAVIPFGRGLDPASMVAEVVDGALDDAGIPAEDLDALVVANAAAEGFCGIGNVSVWTATQAGLAGVPCTRVDTGPSSGLAGLWAARSLVAGGHAETVLLVGWEAMTGISTGEATRVLGTLMSEDEQALDLSLPGLVAMLTSAYLERYGLAMEEIAHVPVKAHRMAASNPIAQFQDPIRVEDVMGSRVIADPLRLLHCAPLTDGAAAVVLAREGPVEIEAMGHATDALGYAERRSSPERFQATRQAADALWSRTERGPEDIDVAEVHDAFSVLEPVNLEDLGFAEDGQGLELVPTPDEDPLSYDLVVNPGGGLKARGHPVGASGVAQLTELYDQLTGRAANQVDGARTALAHSIGGFGNNVHCTLLEEATS